MGPAILPSIIVAAELLKAAAVLSVLLYTSWLDLRTREVEPRLWLYAAAPLLAVSLGEASWFAENADRTLLLVHLGGGLLAVGLMAALYYLGMMGGGDLFAAALILCAHPWPPMARWTLMPFLLDILVYSAIAFVAVVPAVMLYNIVFHRGELRRIEGAWNRAIAAATGIPVRVDEYVGSRAWLFPLEDYRSGRRAFRHSFDIEEDPEEHRRVLRSLLEQGVLRPEDRIWVTYGIPFLIPMTAGYVAALLLGDRLVLALIGVLGAA